ncbi:hypothetical protein DRO29_07955 [Candidatus Bathyarchaeota archaeon]|nr:MAG: hypothetical protein DRO29_07955 [Candidatus Bathyarchaeota archaeon]
MYEIRIITQIPNLLTDETIAYASDKQKLAQKLLSLISKISDEDIIEITVKKLEITEVREVDEVLA